MARPWTKSDLCVLKIVLAVGSCNYLELGAILNRSRSAIRQKISAMRRDRFECKIGRIKHR